MINPTIFYGIVGIDVEWLGCWMVGYIKYHRVELFNFAKEGP